MEIGSREKTILHRIVDARRASIAHRKRVLPQVALKIAVEKKAPPARDFSASLSRNRINIIAELKKASPSLGVIRVEYAPAVLADELEQAGAAALSVLTEEDFFSGSLADLKEARRVVQIPVLRKDFIVDPWQVWEARAAGADSFLLIAAVLDDQPMNELIELGRSLGMEPLVEVHSAEELDRVLRAGARACFLAWGPFDQPYWRSMMGVVHGHVGGPLLQPGGPDPFRFAQPGSLSELLRKAGFCEVHEETKTLPWTWPGTPEEVWEQAQAVSVPFRAMLDRVPESLWPQIHEEVHAAIGEYVQGENIAFGASVVLASGRK